MSYCECVFRRPTVAAAALLLVQIAFGAKPVQAPLHLTFAEPAILGEQCNPGECLFALLIGVGEDHD